MSDNLLDLYLEDQLTRIRLMIQRYMRRNADRLQGFGKSYTDAHVGRAELQRGLMLAAPRSAQTWLDELGMPPLANIETTLKHQDDAVQRQLAHDDAGAIPLEMIRARFGLTPIAFDLLLAAMAPRFSEEIARLYAVAWADFSIKQPYAGFLAELVCPSKRVLNDAIAELGPQGTLRRCALIECHQQERWLPRTPLQYMAVSVPQRIIDFALGQDLHSSPTELGITLHLGARPLGELAFAADQPQRLSRTMRKTSARVTLLGEPGSGRLTLMRSLADARGRAVLEVKPTLAPEASINAPWWLAQVLREARLHRAHILLRLDGQPWSPDADQMNAVHQLLGDFPGTVAFTAARRQEIPAAWLTGTTELTFGPLPMKTQRDMWLKTLTQAGHDKDETLWELMARRYQLTPGAIVRAARQATEQARVERSPVTIETLESAVRVRIVHRLDDLARTVVPHNTLADVVLPEDRRQQLEEILSYARHADQVYNQWGFAHNGALGLSVLFSGPPGTGKTMTSSVLARELGRVLYQIDLSRVVDKYIGETEKNLGRIFDEAQKAQAVLLFDEADSLFAGSTSVKSSNDRYANLEVNFLLQRLEEYSGISILTTNAPHSLDEAFQRRIRFKIDFPKPDAPLRQALWERHIPDHARDDKPIDWEALAEAFELSGGHIRNAALRGAFKAAEEGSGITEDMLFDAAEAEARELGLLIPHFS